MADRLPPGVLDLTDLVEVDSSRPVGHGAYADVYKQKLGKIFIAVKVLRTHTQSLISALNYEKRIYDELSTWTRLKHENILELLGVLYWEGNKYPSFVSRWMGNGQVNSYLKRTPDADFMYTIRGIAKGLAYLHSQSVAHGDIRGDNILVDAQGKAVIADFGLSKWITEAPMSGASSNASGCRRYMPVEYYSMGIGQAPLSNSPIPARRSRAADVWAYGMTVLELWTGNLPYYEYSEAIAIVKLSKRELPSLPEHPQHAQWAPLARSIQSLLNATWVITPSERISMDEVDHLLSASPGISGQRERSDSDSSGSTESDSSVSSSFSNSLRLVTDGLAASNLFEASVLEQVTLSSSPTAMIAHSIAEHYKKPPPSPVVDRSGLARLSARHDTIRVSLSQEITPTNTIQTRQLTVTGPSSTFTYSSPQTILPASPAPSDHVLHTRDPVVHNGDTLPKTSSVISTNLHRQRSLPHSVHSEALENQSNATPHQRLDVSISFISVLHEYLTEQRELSGLTTQCEHTGPDNLPDWEAELLVRGQFLGRGRGWTKQAAKEKAAFNAIIALMGSGDASRGLHRILIKKLILCPSVRGQIRWNTTYAMTNDIPDWRCTVMLYGDHIAEGRGVKESIAQDAAAVAAWPRLAQTLSWSA